MKYVYFSTKSTSAPRNAHDKNHPANTVIFFAQNNMVHINFLTQYAMRLNLKMRQH